MFGYTIRTLLANEWFIIITLQLNCYILNIILSYIEWDLSLEMKNVIELPHFHANYAPFYTNILIFKTVLRVVML